MADKDQEALAVSDDSDDSGSEDGSCDLESEDDDESDDDDDQIEDTEDSNGVAQPGVTAASSPAPCEDDSDNETTDGETETYALAKGAEDFLRTITGTAKKRVSPKPVGESREQLVERLVNSLQCYHKNYHQTVRDKKIAKVRYVRLQARMHAMQGLNHLLQDFVDTEKDLGHAVTKPHTRTLMQLLAAYNDEVLGDVEEY